MKQRMTIDAKNAEGEKRMKKEEDPLIPTAVLAEAARLEDLEDILLVEEHLAASKS